VTEAITLASSGWRPFIQFLPWGAFSTGIGTPRDLYDYLHAATSRALYFSAGEIMRRGWGHPHGRMTTDKRK
jgi:hypothetical protein